MIHPINSFLPDVIWPICTLINPCTNQADGFCVEGVVLGRHYYFFVQTGDEMHERAFGAITGNNGFTHFATFKGEFFIVDAVSAFLLIWSVALYTMFFKERPYFFFEIDFVLCRRG